jgi:homoserine acetyltransferase
MFEQEMLAWSKESEQLKRLVKQIQIENNKLKDIIFQFEQKIHDYLHENERLKHENQHLSLIKYSSIQKDHFITTSDDNDICYLTLKCLTYEVAQRTSNNNEPLSLLTNHSQQSNDTERQVRISCI